jgi:hypothetical protein
MKWVECGSIPGRCMWMFSISFYLLQRWKRLSTQRGCEVRKYALVVWGTGTNKALLLQATNGGMGFDSPPVVRSEKKKILHMRRGVTHLARLKRVGASTGGVHQ